MAELGDADHQEGADVEVAARRVERAAGGRAPRSRGPRRRPPIDQRQEEPDDREHDGVEHEGDDAVGHIGEGEAGRPGQLCRRRQRARPGRHPAGSVAGPPAPAAGLAASCLPLPCAAGPARGGARRPPPAFPDGAPGRRSGGAPVAMSALSSMASGPPRRPSRPPARPALWSVSIPASARDESGDGRQPSSAIARDARPSGSAASSGRRRTRTQPPMRDISTLGSLAVASERSSE